MSEKLSVRFLAVAVLITVALTGIANADTEGDAPVEVRTSNVGPTAPVVDGLYALQLLSEFDVLDGVVVDPRTGDFSLVGHEERPGRVVPYLDYLRAAIEMKPDASFSLRGTPDWHRQVGRLMRRSGDEMAGQLVLAPGGGRLSEAGKWLFYVCGVSFDRYPSVEQASYPSLGVSLRGTARPGVRVLQVFYDSAAYHAGVRKGDRIVAVDGEPVNSTLTLVRKIRAAGRSAIRLEIERDTEPSAAPLTIWATPKQRIEARNNPAEIVETVYELNGNPEGGKVWEALSDLVDAAETGEGGDQANANLFRQLEITYEVNRIRNSSSTFEQKIEELMRVMADAVARKLQIPNQTRRFVAEYRQLLNQMRADHALGEMVGRMFSAASGDLEGKLGTYLKRCLPEYVHFPPKLIAKMYDVDGTVTPEFNGMAANTLLAAVALRADVAMKRLPYDEALEAELPGFLTWADFSARHGTVNSVHGHMWLEAPEIEVLDSATGHTLSFGKVPVRFRIEEYRGSGRRKRSVSRPDLDRYAEYLTQHYSQIADVYPVLHRMREALKIVAVANWMKAQRFDPQLPQRGYVEWQPPTSVPGFLSLAYQPGSMPHVPEAVFTASGGIDLSLAELRNVAAEQRSWHVDLDTVVIPQPTQSKAIRRLMSTMPKVPPLPKPPGSIARARGGERHLRTLSVMRTEVPRHVDPVRANAMLDAMDSKARVLQHYDNVINEMTDKRIADLRELEEAPALAREELEQMAVEAVDLLTGGIVSLDGFIASYPEHVVSEAMMTVKQARDRGRLPPMMNALANAKKARDVLEDLQKLYRAREDGTFNKEAAIQLAKQARDLTVDVLKDVDGPSVTRAAAAIQAGFKLQKLTERTFAIVELEQLVDQTSSRLGDQAKLAETVQDRRKRADDEFRAMMQEYVQLAGKPAGP